MSLSKSLLLLFFLGGCSWATLAQEPLYRQSHALLINLAASGERRPLREELSADVEGLGRLLTANSWEATILTDLDPALLEASLRKFLADYGNEEKSRLLIYLRGQTRLGEVGGDSPSTTSGSRLSLATIYEMLRSVQSRHLLLIVNGQISDRRQPESKSDGPENQEQSLARPAWISIISGGGQPPRHFRTRFAYYLHRAFERQEADLDDNGGITARELSRYLSEKIQSGQRARWGPVTSSLDPLQGRDPREAGDIEIFQVTRGSSAGETIPAFTWPPPSPSDEWMVPRKWFNGQQTLGQTAEMIEMALESAGYRYSYYRLPGGYALACSLERIHPDGTPIEGPSRWRRELPPLRALSLGEMLRALVGVLPGHYRVIAFLITDQPFSGRGVTANRDEADRWASEGADRLPPSIEKVPFTRDHRVTAFVYEFQQKREGTPATPVDRSRVSARDHLHKAHIYGPMSEFERQN